MREIPAPRPPLIYLGTVDVFRALPMPAAIEAVREAFRDLAMGTVTMPARTRMANPEGDEVSLIMPSQSTAISRLGVKLITLYDKNRALGLPLAQALMILADSRTGLSLAIIEGGALTALRTGAVSGVATDLLARPDAFTAAIFGAGRQGRAQLEGVACVRPIREARVYDQDEKAAGVFAREMTEALKIEVRAASDAASAVRGADIICTATSSCTPVFADGEIAPGTHINAVGVYQPERAEIPPATVQRSHIVVDHREAAMEEAGDLLQPLAAGLISPDALSVELGSVLLGRAEGRRTASEITLFKSVGLAVQDLYAASRAYENAVRLGLGRTLDR